MLLSQRTSCKAGMRLTRPGHPQLIRGAGPVGSVSWMRAGYRHKPVEYGQWCTASLPSIRGGDLAPRLIAKLSQPQPQHKPYAVHGQELPATVTFMSNRHHGAAALYFPTMSLFLSRRRKGVARGNIPARLLDACSARKAAVRHQTLHLNCGEARQESRGCGQKSRRILCLMGRRYDRSPRWDQPFQRVPRVCCNASPSIIQTGEWQTSCKAVGACRR